MLPGSPASWCNIRRPCRGWVRSPPTKLRPTIPRPLGNHQSLMVLSGSIFIFLLCTFKVQLVSLPAKLISQFLTEVFGCGMGEWQQAVLIGGTMFALIF